MIAWRGRELCERWMPKAKEPCGRRVGHRGDCLTAYMLECQRMVRRSPKLYTVGVGVSGTPTHETARLPLTPVVDGPSQPRVESARRDL